jgi:hypothetical protein
MRKCDGCTACCDGSLYMRVEEHKVHRGSPCPYLCKENHNCSNYENRPEVCRNFECFWKVNESVPEWLKPSNSGVVLSYNAQQGRVDAYAVEGMEVKLGTFLSILEFVQSHNLTFVFNVNDTENYYCGFLDFAKNNLKFDTLTRQQMIECTAKLA